MRNGLILMTALPPTLGHRYLIDFALKFLHSYNAASSEVNPTLYVMLFSRDCEPIDGKLRLNTFKEAFENRNREFSTRIKWIHYHGEVPQDPSESPDFWKIWKKLIEDQLVIADSLVFQPSAKPGFVFSSDHYGKDVAKTIGWEWIPCNTYREVVDVSATRIRHDPIREFANILPEFQPALRRTVTFFGAESTGKTTLSRLMSKNLNGHWVPEWAREYMEVLRTTTVTDELMDRVTHAQFAAEQAVDEFSGKPFIFRDTDLLSTIGYYRIWHPNRKVPQTVINRWRANKANLYILMNDMIPFSPDPLRFGGNVRESNNQFWIKLLKEYECNFHIVHASYRERQEEEVTTVIRNEFLNHANGLGMFLRLNQEGHKAA